MLNVVFFYEYRASLQFGAGVSGAECPHVCPLAAFVLVWTSQQTTVVLALVCNDRNWNAWRVYAFGLKPARAIPNWQAPSSTGKPAGHRGAARWRCDRNWNALHRVAVLCSFLDGRFFSVLAGSCQFGTVRAVYD